MSFDLLHRGGRDLRREPIEVRKATPAKLLRGAKSGIELSEHLQGGGPNCVAKPKRIGVGRRALRLIGARCGGAAGITGAADPVFTLVTRNGRAHACW
jgi:hypothetical protein